MSWQYLLMVFTFVLTRDLFGTEHAAHKKMLKQRGGIEENIMFLSQEGDKDQRFISRKGILKRKPGARAVILMCHGFMCNRVDALCLRSIFDNYHTLTFDFRAHGDNIEGQCCSFGKYEAYDVIGAVKWIKSDPELKDLPIIVYGFSMGAVASIAAQSMDPSLFKAAIWDCPFESTFQLIGRGIEHLKFTVCGYELYLPEIMRKLIHHYAYHPYIQAIFKIALKTVSKMDASPVATCIAPMSPKDVIKTVTIPAYFISCIEDDKAPVAAVSQVYENAAGFKRLWITQGRRHFDSYFYNPEVYKYRLNKFIEDVLSDNYQTKAKSKIIHDEPTLYGDA